VAAKVIIIVVQRKFENPNTVILIFPLAVIFFCRFACLSRQTGGGQSHRQTVQLGQNFKGLPNKNYCR
jgi:hypothetical protein